jgi:hypothetical protein
MTMIICGIFDIIQPVFRGTFPQMIRPQFAGMSFYSAAGLALLVGLAKL